MDKGAQGSRVRHDLEAEQQQWTDQKYQKLISEQSRNRDRDIEDKCMGARGERRERDELGLIHIHDDTTYKIGD